MIFDDDLRTFVVLVNDEGQYSVWPEEKPAPAGWANVGVEGLKADCLAYIENIWTDMRPASLRSAKSADQ